MFLTLSIADQRAVATQFQGHLSCATPVGPINDGGRISQTCQRSHIVQARQEDIAERHGVLDASAGPVQRPELEPQIRIERNLGAGRPGAHTDARPMRETRTRS